MYTGKTICVFCSSSNKIKKKYLDDAEKLGKKLSLKNIICLNGGGVGEVGSMGRLNKGIYENNGHNISIIHEIWIDKENYVKHEHLKEEIVLKGNDLSERKKIMRDKSDAFIILPGGTGTVDELMEIIELKKSGFHNKDIIIVNSDGFYDPIINMLKKIKNENFISEDVDVEKLYKIVYEIDDIEL